MHTEVLVRRALTTGAIAVTAVVWTWGLLTDPGRIGAVVVVVAVGAVALVQARTKLPARTVQVVEAVVGYGGVAIVAALTSSPLLSAALAVTAAALGREIVTRAER